MSDPAALAFSRWQNQLGVCRAMPISLKKTARGRTVAVSRQAGKVLKAAQDAADIHNQRGTLKQELKVLSREARARQRKVAVLKRTAAEVDLTDLMHMLMMKAYIHNVRHEGEVESASGASSSSTAWVPRDGVEALDRLRLLASSCTDPEVMEFAKSMQLIKPDAVPQEDLAAGESRTP